MTDSAKSVAFPLLHVELVFGKGIVPAVLSRDGADFSDCRRYRYRLWRTWDDTLANGVCVFIGLNPSTADESLDDPTIRRCIDSAKRWGFSGLMMLNLFAWRATSPTDMKAQKSVAVGKDNDRVLRDECKAAKMVIAAWGNHGAFRMRGAEVKAMLEKAGVRLHVLRLTKGGFPEHPLYLPKELEAQPWL